MTRSSAHNPSQGTAMSGRMIQRIDVITTYSRWVALLAVILIVLSSPSAGFPVGQTVLLAIVGAMAAINFIPLLLIRFGAFGDLEAFTFLLLDSIFALGMMVVDGRDLFCYCFCPSWRTAFVSSGR